MFIFASRGAPPPLLLNAAQNFLSYDYHIVIYFDVALRKSKVDGTLGRGVLLVLIVLTYCPFVTILAELRYVTSQQ